MMSSSEAASPAENAQCVVEHAMDETYSTPEVEPECDHKDSTYIKAEVEEPAVTKVDCKPANRLKAREEKSPFSQLWRTWRSQPSLSAVNSPEEQTSSSSYRSVVELQAMSDTFIQSPQGGKHKEENLTWRINHEFPTCNNSGKSYQVSELIENKIDERIHDIPTTLLQGSHQALNDEDGEECCTVSNNITDEQHFKKSDTDTTFQAKEYPKVETPVEACSPVCNVTIHDASFQESVDLQCDQIPLQEFQKEEGDSAEGLMAVDMEKEDLDTADDFSRSLEKDSSGTDDLIEKARRVSSVFEQRVMACNTTTDFQFPIVLKFESHETQSADCGFLNNAKSSLKDPYDSVAISFDPLSETEMKNDDMKSQSFGMGTSGPKRNVGVVAPLLHESCEVDLKEKIEILKKKIQEQEKRRIAIEEKMSKSNEETTNLAKKAVEYEARVKSMELLAEKKEKETQSLLAKIASKRTLLLNLLKEKNLLDDARNGGLERLQAETSQVNNALMDAEIAFSDVHRRYELTKAAMIQVSQNTEKSEVAMKELRDLIDKREAEINEIQDLTELKKQEAQTKFQEQIVSHGLEKERLTAKLRQAKLKTTLLSSEIDQKTRENEELTEILSDLSISDKNGRK